MKRRAKGRPRRSNRAGREATHGFDPIRQGNARFAGAVPMDKGIAGTRLLYFTSHHEFVAALIAVCHPGIAVIGRGDVSDTAARLRQITGPSGPRCVITGLLGEEVIPYLPDYDARTPSGAQVIIEAGEVRRKAAPRELAKLRAAQSLARLSGGALWVIDSDLVPEAWVRNAVVLYLRSFDWAPAPLVDAIRAISSRETASIKSLIARFAPEYPPEVVEAAGFKVAGCLLREGRLDAPIGRQTFALATRFRALGPEASPIAPPGIIRSVEELIRIADELGGPIIDDLEPEEPAVLPDRAARQAAAMPAAIDADALPPDVREAYLKVMAAVSEQLEYGGSAAARARRHGLDVKDFQRAVRRFTRLGPAALVRHATMRYPRGSYVPERIVARIIELHTGSERLSAQAIVEHPDVHRLAVELGLKRAPGISAVQGVLRRSEQQDHRVRQARAGRALLPATMFGRSIPTNGPAAMVTELDEDFVDLLVLALNGTKVTIRLHMGILICIATRTVLAVVVSPKALDQWDYRRLLLRAFLPKDESRKRHRVRSAWPSGMVCIVRADRGKIETSKLVFQAAADLPIIVEFAPIRDGHGKPFVESFFKVSKQLLEHRLKITTKSSPLHRGAHDPAREAIRGELDVDRIETVLMRWIGDVYHNRHHGGLHATPSAVWADRVAEFGLRRWLRPPDELRSLLKRDAGLAQVTGKGITYRGRWYGARVLTHMGMLRLRRKVDDDDVRTIEVYDEAGAFVAVIGNEHLAKWGRPISAWELTIAAKAARRSKTVSDEQSGAGQRDAVDAATPHRRATTVRRRQYRAERAEEAQTQAERDLLALAAIDPAIPPISSPDTDWMVRPAIPDDRDEPEPLPTERETGAYRDDAA